MTRTLAPLLLALGLGLCLPHSAQAQFGPPPDTDEWKLECTSTPCPEYSRIIALLSETAGGISRWYRAADFPIPRVERTDLGTKRLIHVVLEADSKVCGDVIPLGCFKMVPRSALYIMTESFASDIVDAVFDSPSRALEKPVATLTHTILHEMFHLIQAETAGTAYLYAKLSENTRAALDGKLTFGTDADVQADGTASAEAGGKTLTPEQKADEAGIGSDWLVEGTASAVELAWVARPDTAWQEPYLHKYNLGLNQPLISPGGATGSPYRLGQFLDHVGRAYPGGPMAFLRALYQPGLNDGANGLVFFDGLLKAQGGSLADSFIQFVRLRTSAAPGDEGIMRLRVSFSEFKRVALVIPQLKQLAHEWRPRVAAYAAEVMAADIDPGPAPDTAPLDGVVKVAIAQMSLMEAERPEDLTLIVNDRIAPDLTWRQPYAEGDAPDRRFFRLVNFRHDPLGTRAQDVRLRFEAKELLLGAPLCVLPGRVVSIFVNQEIEGLTFRAEAGRLSAGQVRSDPDDPNSPPRPALIYKAPDKPGTYAITLRTGAQNRPVKVAQVVVTPYPCRVDLVWDDDEATRSRYVFPLPGQSEGQPTAKELGGAEMVIRTAETQQRSGQAVENAPYAAMMRGNLDMLAGALPPDVKAELDALPASERAKVAEAMRNFAGATGFMPGDEVATFDSPTRQFDMLNPHQAVDGIAEMLFRMLLLDRLPSAAELNRMGAPQMVIRRGQTCIETGRSECTRVEWDGISLAYNVAGVLERMDGEEGRVTLIHQPKPRIREELFMLMIMDRLPWEG